ncbi:hemagglutinin repeat-containing protein, partial [Paraburkholderia ultramafica]|uniref:hemagglutinin repeat-containing protein n=1 Tax=Paraburkholderia ultramafica TaxID=1544867 RepID=UPI001582464D
TTDTDTTASTNKSSSASVGVSYGTNGFGVSASMSNAHRDGNSDAAIQNASHVSGANSVTVVSGGDTNIIGSQVSGGQVTANVGGNLNIQSVQDTTVSTAHQSSVSGGFSISQGGGSASFSAQNGHADSNYAQVNEQAGIQAGSGGFDINVKGNTNLTGAVISSTADPTQNSLTTGTLTYGDIQNQSHYDATSNGISAGVGVGTTGKALGPGSVSGTPGVAPMISQNDSGDQSATTRSAISAGTINITNQTGQTQDVATLSRDTTNTNGTVSTTPDVNNLLSQQADTMQAAQAAGQVVAQGIGAYADMKRDEALAAGDKATADAWDEGGVNRAMMQAAGGALIGGLGGGSGLTAIGGAAGAGLSSLMAGQLDQISKGVESATGSELLGNISANIVAGVGGALVGGTAGAATGSAVQLYNQGNDKKKSLVEQVCPAGAQCSDATLSAAIQAQTDLNSVAQDNVRDVSIAGSVVVAGVGAAILAPEALAAYKAAQAGYSLSSAALTGAATSGGIYVFSTAVSAGANSGLNPSVFVNEFSDRFSLEGLAVTSAYGAASSMFGTQMYNWAGVPNSLKNITTAPGIVTRLNSLALGQTLGRAVKSPSSNQSN